MAENVYPLILTDAGKNMIANAIALNQNIEITEMVLGSGAGDDAEGGKNNDSYLPLPSQKALKNEVYRSLLMDSYMDETGKAAFTMLIPYDVGGWYVREVGLYAKEVLFAVGVYPETYKAPNESNVVEDLYIELALIIENAEQVINFKIDPSVMLVTKEYVANNYAGLKNFNEHTGDKDNPHGTTAAQVGAATIGQFNSHSSDFNNPHKVTAAQVGAWAKNENKRIAFHYLNNGTNTTHTTDERLTTWKDLGIHVSTRITPKFEKSVFQFSGLALLGLTVRNKGGAYSSISLEVNETAVAASAYLVFDTQTEGDIGKMQTTCAIAPVGGWGYKNQTGEPFVVGARKRIRSPDSWQNLNQKDFFFGKVDILIIEQEL